MWNETEWIGVSRAGILGDWWRALVVIRELMFFPHLSLLNVR